MAAAKRESKKPESVFKVRGFAEAINAVHEEIRELYLQDDVPWVVGYSGGKDSRGKKARDITPVSPRPGIAGEISWRRMPNNVPNRRCHRSAQIQL